MQEKPVGVTGIGNMVGMWYNVCTTAFDHFACALFRVRPSFPSENTT